MNATLTFNLDNPDDAKAHLMAIKSKDMAIVLWEIEANLRRKLEFKRELWGEVYTPDMVIEACMAEIMQLYHEFDINPQEFIS